jgi:predicted glycoside hydrolase/deacetylase ChbG (UPF0249 family)
MAPGRAFAYAVEQAARCPELGVGVHLTLVGERSGLGGQPLPAGYREFAVGVARGTIQMTNVEAELRAQVERCQQAGLRLTHLDSHQHVHMLPGVLRVVVRLAQEYGIARVRVPYDPPWRAGAWQGARYAQKAALAMLAWRGRRVVRGAGLTTTDRMLGLYESGALGTAELAKLLGMAGEGVTEVITHPGIADAETRQLYGHWGFDWERELRALTAAGLQGSRAMSGT